MMMNVDVDADMGRSEHTYMCHSGGHGSRVYFVIWFGGLVDLT